MSKPWGNIGAWAAEAEAAEEEERVAAAAVKSNPPSVETQNFPSLKESISAKPKKKKMTLNEFYTSSTAAPASSGGSYGRLTPDELLRLPTGPKDRSYDEDDRHHFGGRLGGGFPSYNNRSDASSRYDGGGRRGSYGGGGFDDERRGPPQSRVSEFEPSRADEADNWAAMKRPVSSFNNAPSRTGSGNDRYASLGGGSRSDDVDNWAMGKRAQAPPMAAPGYSRSSSSFGSGFRDSRDPGIESDRWSRGGGGLGDGGARSDRPRLVLNPRTGNLGGNAVENLNDGAKSNRANPFGAARPREEVLAEKGLDYKKIDLEIDAKKSIGITSGGSRPSSAQSSRSESQGDETAVKPRPKVNPFGEAKPREVLLEEKGLDWRKIDSELEHRSVDRPLSEEEKLLKEEIENLRKELDRQVSLKEDNGTTGDRNDVSDALAEKERELEALTRDLDDKVRFGQKGIDRPRSRSGRVGSFSDRPPSRSGSIDDSRSVDYNDRPLSRGSGDAWPRTGNERRGFQGRRDGGFLGSRDFDRSRPRDRW
ncbi:hypothetical protein MLD38_011896 [Melastoma candidum]|uniref:Uncharacterized protein n=1 Tax=Melastoma candidum TaxID=119954 RepID=A0ACB9R7J3_9MYRT|nr:hypothetical protein MLD38_011896 [Melastoma candidum]